MWSGPRRSNKTPGFAPCRLAVLRVVKTNKNGKKIFFFISSSILLSNAPLQ
jgi:hypothetical protein